MDFNLFPKQDFKKAMYYFEQAADAGHPKAIGCIGVLWLNGLGVEKNVQKGLAFLEKSATLGEVHSQYNLGLIYRIGEDVEQDLTKAEFWFKHSAERGLAAAQIDLGILYIKGEGIEADFSESFKWILLGNMNGDERGERLKDYCTENFDKEYLDEGFKLAQEFVQK